jgi:hypothetical protein
MSAYDAFHIADAEVSVRLLVMSGPWFRRSWGFGYIPTTWQGVLLLVTMATVGIFAVTISLQYQGTDPAFADLVGYVAVVTVLAGHILVYWKMDRGHDG